MKRQYTVENASAFRDEEILPLVQFAWDQAWATAPKGRDQLKSHPRYSEYHSQSHNDRACRWHIRLIKSKFVCCGRAHTGGLSPRIRVRIGDPRKLKVTWPYKATYPTYKDMPEHYLNSWREVIISIVAHEVAHLTGYGGGKAGEEMAELTAIDAVDAYRKNQTEIDGRIDQAIKNVDEIAKRTKERTAADRDYKNSAAYKLEKLSELEAAWLRKLKLALTKLKKIKRKRAAINAAQKRKLGLPNSFYQRYNLSPGQVIAYIPVNPDPVEAAATA